MKLGLMQPYFFPYIGYFQLIHAVDRFVLYDDVAFIKQGWINRNRILLHGKDFMFTVPLKNASSFTSIADTEINMPLYNTWRPRFLKTLEQAYAKAPYYRPVADLVADVLHGDSRSINELAASSIINSCNYIGLKREFVLSAQQYNNNELKGKDRVLDICRREAADKYLNVPGGKDLYDRAEFNAHSVTLNFIEPGKISYKQFGDNFIPWLSIIDVMMFNAPQDVLQMVGNYTLN